jgi:hypothetical protein
LCIVVVIIVDDDSLVSSMVIMPISRRKNSAVEFGVIFPQAQRRTRSEERRGTQEVERSCKKTGR